MGSRSIPIPRYFVFTLEDSTWVVQRGADHVQELLTGIERSHSILDTTYEITDIELDLLQAQGIVERYDDAYVWLRDTVHTEGIISMNALERPLGVATYYYVGIRLPLEDLKSVQKILVEMGLDDRYRAISRLGTVVVVDHNGEPFSKLSLAEDAHILISPRLEKLAVSATVKSLRFNSSSLEFPWEETTNEQSLIRRLAPEIKGHTIVCVDDEETTHRIVRDVLTTWGVEVASAYNGRDAMTLISDVDPVLILTDLKLPDMHGYEIVAHVRNNPDLSHIPLIIISAVDTPADRLFAYNTAAALDYVVKPFSGEEIRRKVWRVLS
ncbi:MAG: response regulator [Chloroflexi bacterium]|nr:response regulator [Chloroflexota bacterium]